MQRVVSKGMTRCLPALGVLLLAASAAAQEKEKATLLVMPLKAEKALQSQGRALDEMILESIHSLDRYKVLGPADLNAVLGVEQLKDAMGCTDVSCAAEIGGALGAPFLVAGDLRSLGDQVVLSLRLMDTTKPAVLTRGTARGPNTGDALVQMMARAVGKCFKTKINVGTQTTAPTPTTPTPAAGANPYARYTEMMMALGKRMSNSEYTAMLKDLDEYDRVKVNAPPGQDKDELLTYYRAIACHMLKRTDCLKLSAKKYVKNWPTGMYATAIQTYLDQLEDEAMALEDNEAELQERLREIQEYKRKGSWDAAMVEEMTGYAYLNAKQYAEAAKYFGRSFKRHQDNAEKAMQILQSLAMALEQGGHFEQARKVLTQGQQKHPRAFRKAGLHHTLRRLPK